MFLDTSLNARVIWHFLFIRTKSWYGSKCSLCCSILPGADTVLTHLATIRPSRESRGSPGWCERPGGAGSEETGANQHVTGGCSQSGGEQAGTGEQCGQVRTSMSAVDFFPLIFTMCTYIELQSYYCTLWGDTGIQEIIPTEIFSRNFLKFRMDEPFDRCDHTESKQDIRVNVRVGPHHYYTTACWVSRVCTALCHKVPKYSRFPPLYTISFKR